MCGRYAFYQRPSEVRRQLEDAHMQVDECPDDDACRQTYNFPPGAFGIVYRANVPDYGAGPKTQHDKGKKAVAGDDGDDEPELKTKAEDDADSAPSSSQTKETRYKLQPMKWGLVPSWTKRSPDYGSVMKTINARDDSLAENRGMWNIPKKRKRCIVVAQGFYEWLKKSGGKEKTPHYIKRKDNQLMCMAGLWDCVKYEGEEEKHYTYSIITTSNNKQMSFLHDRMPVILGMGSEEMKMWLDPGRYEWTRELQSILKPYQGELDIYPVSKDVGKVGNDSPSFIIPIDSKENKNNIANFFGNQKAKAKDADAKKNVVKAEQDEKENGTDVKKEAEETRETTNKETAESNAPMPSSPQRGVKREHSPDASPVKRAPTLSHEKVEPAKPAKKMKSATSNDNAAKQKSPTKGALASKGTPKITKFFGK